jgi:hypothetical protein
MIMILWSLIFEEIYTDNLVKPTPLLLKHTAVYPA